MKTALFLAAAGLALTVAGFLPSGRAEGPVGVTDPWVRATVPGQNVAGAYLEIVSTRDAALVSAASPAAGLVEIHTMTMEGDVMRMRAVDRIELPAGKPVKLAPGGYHIMLMDLKRELKEGDTVPITLTIEGREQGRATIQLTAPVRAGPGHHHHGRGQ